MSTTTEPRVIYEDDKVKQIIRQTGEGKILVQTIDKPAPERKHHDFSPSTLAMREACPCYTPRGGTSEAAERGTLQHAAAETESDYADLTDDEAEAVAVCLEFVESRRTQMPGCTELKEPYLPIDAGATTAGYADIVLVSADETHAEIADHKFGAWAVDAAETNPQGICYVLGIFFNYPKTQTVTMHFIQPKLNRVSSHTFSRADEPALRLRVNTIVARAKLGTADETFSQAAPNTPGCLFCGNLGRCPKAAEIALKVGHKFHPLAVPEDITPSVALDPANTTLAMRLTGVVSAWAEAFRRQTCDRVICQGAPIPEGFELKQGTGRRSVVDAAKFRAVALLSISPEDLEKIASYGLTDAEALINSKAMRGQKKVAVEEFRKALLEEGAVKAGEAFTYLKAKSDE